MLAEGILRTVTGRRGLRGPTSWEMQRGDQRGTVSPGRPRPKQLGRDLGFEDSSAEGRTAALWFR